MTADIKTDIDTGDTPLRVKTATGVDIRSTHTDGVLRALVLIEEKADGVPLLRRVTTDIKGDGLIHGTAAEDLATEITLKKKAKTAMSLACPIKGLRISSRAL